MTTRKSETISQTNSTSAGPTLVSLDAAVFNGVSVNLDAKLGSVTLTVQELLALKAGEIVRLDAQLNDLVEISLNGALVGRGEIVAVNDSFGVRIVEIATAT